MKKEKSKGWLKKAYVRFLWLGKGLKGEDLQKQFTYLMSGTLYKKKMKDKGFKPFKISKMARKMIRSGRLA